MERETDGWHLELVAFGSGGMRADAPLAAVSGLKELRQVPLKRDDWERRDFGLSLDAKGGHEQQPIHISVRAYGRVERDDFVPKLGSADGVLFVESGDKKVDDSVLALVSTALSERPGSPPVIIERGTVDEVKVPLRTLVKRTVLALKTGALNEFWKQSTRKAEAAHDAEVFGPLTKERILTQPEGELVAFLLRVVQARGRRAVVSGRLLSSDAYDRCLSARWQRLFAVNALEMLVRDAGIAALFGAAGHRAMEREEVTAALAALKRIGATKKAAIVERALVVARESRLWEGAGDETAASVLEELSQRFYAVDDEPLRVRLEEDIRKAPDEFTLGAYED